eukprot:2297322-Pleurochrysis_carterae.AAC.2
MAEPAGQRAGAMFSPPPFPLSQGADLLSGRTRRAGQQEQFGSSHRGWGVASGPPTRPSERLWRAGAPGEAESTHLTGPRGRKGGRARWPLSLEAQPNLV